MCTERPHHILDKHTLAFIGLLLRKGYQDKFTLHSGFSEPTEGSLEICMARFQQDLLLQRLQEAMFSLSTRAHYASTRNDRWCVLDVHFHSVSGYHIQKISIHSPAIRQARVISFNHNDDLPFLRHIREARLPFPRWPSKVVAWLQLIIPKNFK